MKTLTLQSVLIPKNNFTLRDAYRYMLEHDYKNIKKPHLTVGYYRFRQRHPSTFENKKFYTRRAKNGVLLVYGKLIEV